MLPKAVPTARIMRFGYESSWYGSDKDEPKKTYVADIAEMLLKGLEIHRRVSQFFKSTLNSTKAYLCLLEYYSADNIHCT
jgi:hypothetical protein